MKHLFICVALLQINTLCNGQEYTNARIESIIKNLRLDPRGPYKDIKWFCDDGTVREAKDPCPDEIGGVQHARYKDLILDIADKNHLFLGQILTGSDAVKFFDEENRFSRYKQYILEQYLINSDNGWILEKGQYYRGAKQIEDEKEWGLTFFQQILTNNAKVRDNYLLIRLGLKNIPHGEDTNIAQKVRAYSKILADSEKTFMDLRIKIHNNPDATDLNAVRTYKVQSYEKLDVDEKKNLDLLLESLDEQYKPFKIGEANKIARYLPEGSLLRVELEKFSTYEDAPQSLQIMEACEILPLIRDNIFETSWPVARLELLDFTNKIEEMIILNFNNWEDTSITGLRDKLCFLTQASYGLGYIHEWEYEYVLPELTWMVGDAVAIDDLKFFQRAAKKSINWSVSLVNSLFLDEIKRYMGFEPKIKGFIDDAVRSTMLIQLGKTLEEMDAIIKSVTNQKSDILDLKNTGQAYGLNPGIALGELVVISDIPDDYKFDARKIYVFDRPPGELPPVSGIANVQEGNPISHIQLLARNLGIPNALITTEILNNLNEYNGRKIFYAVSPDGVISMKLEEDMSELEKEIVLEKERVDNKVKVTVDHLHLEPDTLLDMSAIDASYSGKWCGPKAANLGQLKKMFPDKVVEGIVIPFGVFKSHMEQEIPSLRESYWTFLKRIFQDKKLMEIQGIPDEEIECIVIQELKMLQDYILKMPLKNSLISRLENRFLEVLGQPMGNIPVFLRSDTNMEDLAEFTGAGLNLTLFNILDRNEILEGIKKVWASPYTERSYKWRQSYLQNPEDVYPSILLIPSVNVDHSGVVITKGLTTNDDQDITIAFSKGAGGAVDGQSAESYILHDKGYNELTSPSREYRYRVIPSTGGSMMGYTDFSDQILNVQDMFKIRELVKEVGYKMVTEIGQEGPYDIELGFKDGNIWLFQIRPFVENNSALRSEYLQSLEPKTDNLYIELK